MVEESKPSASATIIAIFPPLLYPNVLVGFDPYFTVASLTCFLAANICGFSFSKPVKISASIFQSLILLNLVPRNAKRVSFVSGLFKTKPSALLNSVSILKGILLSSKKSCVIEKSSLSWNKLLALTINASSLTSAGISVIFGFIFFPKVKELIFDSLSFLICLSKSFTFFLISFLISFFWVGEISVFPKRSNNDFKNSISGFSSVYSSCVSPITILSILLFSSVIKFLISLIYNIIIKKYIIII